MYYNSSRYDYNRKDGFINIISSTAFTYQNHGFLTLALEDKVTIMGLGYDSIVESISNNKFHNLIYVGMYQCVFIMRAGSRLTGHNTGTSSASSSYSAVLVTPGAFDYDLYGKFMLEGGSIDHNKFAWTEYVQTQHSAIVAVSTGTANYVKMFVWTGGSVSDNVRYWAPNNAQSGNVQSENLATVSLHGVTEEPMSNCIPQ
jgi:hypothetical protein